MTTTIRRRPSDNVRASFVPASLYARSVPEMVQAAARIAGVQLRPAFYSTPSSGRLKVQGNLGPFLLCGLRPLTFGALVGGGALVEVSSGGRTFIDGAAIPTRNEATTSFVRHPNDVRALEAPVPVAAGGALVVKRRDNQGDFLAHGFHVRDEDALARVLRHTGVAWARGVVTYGEPITVDRDVILRGIGSPLAAAATSYYVEVDGMRLTPGDIIVDPTSGGSLTSTLARSQPFATTADTANGIPLPGIACGSRFAIHAKPGARIYVRAAPLSSWPANVTPYITGVAAP